MKLVSVLQRNAAVALLLVLLTILRVVSGFALHWLLIAIVVFCGFLWANRAVISGGNSFSAIVLRLLLRLLIVAAIGFPVGATAMTLARKLVEWHYTTQGLQLVDGCNAAAANMADFDAFAIIHRLNEVTNSPHPDANEIVRLQFAYAAAQEKARILSDDCWRRGHRDNHPWKTNWQSIKPSLAVSEQESH